MRRIQIPHKVLAWVVVDLDTEEVVDVYLSDLLENFDQYPPEGGDSQYKVVDEEESHWTARGLCDLRDFPEGRDEASDEETIAAGRVLAHPDKTWPALRIEESIRP